MTYKVESGLRQPHSAWGVMDYVHLVPMRCIFTLTKLVFFGIICTANIIEMCPDRNVTGHYQLGRLSLIGIFEPICDTVELLSHSSEEVDVLSVDGMGP